MNSETWIERLQTLLERFSHLSIGADIAALSLIELWGVYCYLSRFAYSTETGHSVHGKLDSRSVATRGVFFTPDCRV